MANNPLPASVRLPEKDEADSSLADTVLMGKIPLGRLAFGDVAGANLGDLRITEFVRVSHDHVPAAPDHFLHVAGSGSLVDVPLRLGIQGVAAEPVIASMQAEGLRPSAVDEVERDEVGRLRASAIEAEFSGAHPEDPATRADGLSPWPAFIIATAVNPGPETGFERQVRHTSWHASNNTSSNDRRLG